MARKISFTKAERAALDMAILLGPERDDDTEVMYAGLESLIAKMVAATAADTSPPGLDPGLFCTELQFILGPRLGMPPAPDHSWWGWVGKILKQQGLDHEGAKRVARAAGKRYKGIVGVGTILNNIPALLAEVPETPVAAAPRTGIGARREFTGDE